MARPGRRRAVPIEEFLAATWTVTSAPLEARPVRAAAAPQAAASLPPALPAPPPVPAIPRQPAEPTPPAAAPSPSPDADGIVGEVADTSAAAVAGDVAGGQAGEVSGSSVGGLGARAARNTVVVLSGRVLSRLVALVTVIAVSRHLGADGFGRFQTLVTYTALVAVVVDLGFNTLYVREGARRPDLAPRYLDNVLSIKALLSVAGLLVLALALRVPGLTDLVAPGMALMVTSAYSNLLRGTFYITGRLTYEAVAIVVEAVVQLGLSGVGFATHQGLAYFVWVYAASYAVSSAWFLVVTVRLGLARPRWRLEPAILRPWLVSGLPLAVTYVLTNVYFKVDVPILQRARPYDEVGWYTLAYRPFEALLFVPFTIRQIVFPVISVYSRSRPERLQLGVETLFRALLMAGWPCTVGLALLTPGVTSLLRLYPESEPALRILALGLVVLFVDNTFNAALNAIDRQGTFAAVALTGLGVNLALDLILIPSHGYLGAATATVVTEVVLVIIGWSVLRRQGLRLDVVRLGWRIVAAGALMGAVLLPFRDAHGLALVGVVVLGGAADAAFLLLLRALTADERALVGRLRQGLAVRRR